MNLKAKILNISSPNYYSFSFESEDARKEHVIRQLLFACKGDFCSFSSYNIFRLHAMFWAFIFGKKSNFLLNITTSKKV